MTKEEFMVLASEKYENLQKLNEHLNFYDYEKAFDELWTELGRPAQRLLEGVNDKEAIRDKKDQGK